MEEPCPICGAPSEYEPSLDVGPHEPPDQPDTWHCPEHGRFDFRGVEFPRGRAAHEAEIARDNGFPEIPTAPALTSARAAMAAHVSRNAALHEEAMPTVGMPEGLAE